jgi:hypothetical protein
MHLPKPRMPYPRPSGAGYAVEIRAFKSPPHIQGSWIYGARPNAKECWLKQLVMDTMRRADSYPSS